MIFVTTGTQSKFPRLVEMVDSIVQNFNEKLIIQDGTVLN